MIRTLYSAAFLLILSALSVTAEDWSRFEGAWFTADAPAAFTAKITANAVADDSPMTVRFEAPGGEVAFFIHAPLWAAPTSEVEGEEGEVLSAERTAKIKSKIWA